MKRITGLGIAIIAAIAAGAARAQDAAEEVPVVGAPWAGGVDFQIPATELARDIQWLDGMVTVIVTAITAFVFALILWVMYRYNRRKNETPATFTHNTPVEIAWTIVPVLILVFIGAFSLPVLFKQQIIPEADITIKVTGYQWYWGYEYEDEGIEFEQFMLGKDMPREEANLELADYGFGEDAYLLATDNPIVLPVGATVVMNVTGADVIHSWTIPAFGVKQDAVPGRLAQLWFTPEREGWYFGQCSELCGKDHAYMPITVKVVSPEAYAAWLTENGGASVQTAAAEG